MSSSVPPRTGRAASSRPSQGASQPGPRRQHLRPEAEQPRRRRRRQRRAQPVGLRRRGRQRHQPVRDAVDRLRVRDRRPRRLGQRPGAHMIDDLHRPPLRLAEEQSPRGRGSGRGSPPTGATIDERRLRAAPRRSSTARRRHPRQLEPRPRHRVAAPPPAPRATSPVNAAGHARVHRHDPRRTRDQRQPAGVAPRPRQRGEPREPRRRRPPPPPRRRARCARPAPDRRGPRGRRRRARRPASPTGAAPTARGAASAAWRISRASAAATGSACARASTSPATQAAISGPRRASQGASGCGESSASGARRCSCVAPSPTSPRPGAGALGR